MDYTINAKKDITNILEKKNTIYTYEILERTEIMFLPIKFTTKNNYNFYPSIFSFISSLFEIKLVNDLFSFDATHLEAIDKKNFIIHFAFRNRQIIN